jgi:hypothetical protein
MRPNDYAQTVWNHVMQHAKRMHEWEHFGVEEQRLLSQTPKSDDDGPEFSSEPMPAAFSACLFLGAAIVIGALLAIFW